MTDAYLRSLGFAPPPDDTRANRPVFAQAWRYQHECLAEDGTELFIEHPLGINRCRLSTLLAPLRPEDVLADVALQDRAGLESAVHTFFQSHGGQGALHPIVHVALFRPYRRQR